jgi:hypothetical protein
MAITQNYVDYGAGNDTTGDGSVGTPWKTLQKAFDSCTRNTTDGNQINLKAGTAHVNSAALDLTTFVGGGALASAAPLILRGYTSTANDGGVGEIDCGGYAMWAAATYDYIILADLECHTFGDNAGISLDTYCVMYRCEVHKGASTPTNRSLISLSGTGCAVLGCYFHTAGTSNGNILNLGAGARAFGNYVAAGTGASSVAIFLGYDGIAVGNIILCAHVSAQGISSRRGQSWGNVCYNTAAGTASGILHGTENATSGLVMNNIVCGWSGAGGEGISHTNIGPVGWNAFYNNTANYTVADMWFLDLSANDVSLAADPFTDAANGDFSLTTAAKVALRSLGWPASYLGAAAGTDPHITIGPMQYGPIQAVNLLRGRLA